MTENLRGKRVGSLIKEELARFFIEDVQGKSSGFITVTRVDLTKDLMTARVFLSVFGAPDREAILALLEKRKGHIRKILASRIKLKYNPELFFSLDPVPEYEERLDQLIEKVRKS